MKTRSWLSGRRLRPAAGAAIVAAGMVGVPPALMGEEASVVQLAQSQFPKIPVAPAPKPTLKVPKLAVPLAEISVPVTLENVHADVNKAIVECWLNSGPDGESNRMTKLDTGRVEVPLAKMGFLGSSYNGTVNVAIYYKDLKPGDAPNDATGWSCALSFVTDVGEVWVGGTSGNPAYSQVLTPKEGTTPVAKTGGPF